MIINLFIFCCLIFLVQGLIEQTKPIYGSHQLITYVVDWVKKKNLKKKLGLLKLCMI